MTPMEFLIRLIEERGYQHSPHLRLVIADQEKRGIGAEDDPVRMVDIYFTLDGCFLAEFDPCGTDSVKKSTTQEKHNVG
ncbi:MAG: hypothetical protein KGL39_06910 [Patescibacteria group bacterium]|nr:hypothetical protein [Patescibacteria group bacterium]